MNNNKTNITGTVDGEKGKAKQRNGREGKGKARKGKETEMEMEMKRKVSQVRKVPYRTDAVGNKGNGLLPCQTRGWREFGLETMASHFQTATLTGNDAHLTFHVS